MKKILSLFMALAVMAFVASPAFAAKPSEAGFDEFRYNDTARIFNGTGADWCLARGDSADCLGIYSADKLVMKWNSEWDRGNAEGWTDPNGYDAYLNNVWNGKVPGGSGETEIFKCKWVGAGSWDFAGTYGINVKYLGVDYPETLVLTQDGANITGVSLDTVPFASASHFEVTGGSVSGDTINIVAVNGGLTINMTGTIAPDGSMSGTWADVSPGTRTGEWSTTSGTAVFNNGPLWSEGGYRIWGQFEALMDHYTGRDSLWLAHAIPNGYGAK